MSFDKDLLVDTSMLGSAITLPSDIPLGENLQKSQKQVYAFDDPCNPSISDLMKMEGEPYNKFFELNAEGKIVPKFQPIRNIIKNPKGRVDYGWDERMKNKHLRAAYSRGWQQFPYRPPHNGVVHIVGGGPSLKRCLPELRKLAKKKGHFVLALNKTHDFLLNLPKLGYGEAIKPWGAVLLDPCDWVKDYITPKKGVQYFIADQCSPETFDVFEKEGITKWVWRATNPKKDLGIPYPGMMFIPGGSTVGLRSRSLMYFCGFRTIHYWGFDSSAEVSEERPDGKMHGYEKVESVKDRLTIKVKDEEGFDRDFVTNSHMSRQAQEFLEIREEWVLFVRMGKMQWINETFHGDGLLPTMAARLGIHADKKLNVMTNMQTIIPGDLAEGNTTGELKNVG